MTSTRTVSITTPSDTEVTITRVFKGPRRVVFDAWTKPELVPKWMTGPDGWTMPVCEIDLRAGGKWHFVWRKSSGTEMPMNGVYKEVVTGERIVFTERWGPEWPETLNTVVFTEARGVTTVTLTMSYPSKAARDAAMKTGMADGLEASYTRLDTVVATMS